MKQFVQFQRLADSNRWTFFLESTAAGLQVNLTILPAEGHPRFQTETACVACSRYFAPLIQSEVDSLREIISTNPEGGEFLAASGTTAVVLPIRDGHYLAVRDCHCSGGQLKMNLHERANIVRQLVSSFQAALSESQVGGQRSTELSTLRRMNHIILSMFQEGKEAMEHALDLILSALVILTGAQGSWLEYRRGTEHLMLVKGDGEAVRAYIEKQNGEAMSVDVANSRFDGRLGVLAPDDNEQAFSLLTLLMEECVIVFEIEFLFQLVRTHLKLVLGSLSSAILLVDQHGDISYVNCAAEQLCSKEFSKLVSMPASSVDAPWTPFLADKTNKK